MNNMKNNLIRYSLLCLVVGFIITTSALPTVFAEQLASENVQSKTILKYIVSTTKDVVLSMGRELSPSQNYTYETFYEPQNVAGFCELAEAVIIFLCDDLNIPRSAITRFQGTSCLGDKGIRHASIILTLNDKQWLIDPTFNQFMDLEDVAPNQIGFPGVLLRETHRGRHIAYKLVKQGYIRFDNSTANLYGKVMSRNPELSDYDVQFFKDNDEGEYKITRFILGPHTWNKPPSHLINQND